MSGGSYNYAYTTIENLYAGSMYDKELDDLMEDLAEVCHDLEWWQSCDIGEDDYRKTVEKFKEKWFKQDRKIRLKSYIDNELKKTKSQLYKMIEGDKNERKIKSKKM